MVIPAGRKEQRSRIIPHRFVEAECRVVKRVGFFEAADV
jgi:hypothetical protein